MSAEERDNSQPKEQQPHEQEDQEGDQEEQQRIVHAELGEMNEIESMCPNPACQLNGMTRLMITDVPFFKKVIVSSFSCPHCNESNTEIQFGGEFGPKRTRHHLHIKGKDDMARQVVKSEYATLKIPELELELPRETQKGSLNTVEGILVHTIEGLQFEQPVRRAMQPEFAKKIDEFCEKLEQYRGGDIPFSLILDDPAGNSFIQPRYDYFHPTIDPQLQLFAFPRTDEEHRMLGLSTEAKEMVEAEEAEQARAAQAAEAAAVSGADKVAFGGGAAAPAAAAEKQPPNGVRMIDQKTLGSKHASAIYNQLRSAIEEQKVENAEMPDVFELTDKCPACRAESTIKMHPCDIPHFKQTLIMAFKCDACGYKSTEVQTGGEIPAKGRRVTLRIENEADMKRDVLKSNTASLEVPELELELVAGTLGGFFTTIEGLLCQVLDNLRKTPTISDFGGEKSGDSDKYKDAADAALRPGQKEQTQTSMQKWLDRLQAATEGKILPLTVILDDPLAAVYVQNPRAHLPPPADADPQLTSQEYERSWEQDEDLGLHQMIVENYEKKVEAPVADGDDDGDAPAASS